MKIQFLHAEKFRHSPDGSFSEETWFEERVKNLTARFQYAGHEITEDDPDFRINIEVCCRESENEYPWTDSIPGIVFMPGQDRVDVVTLNCNSRVDVSLLLDTVWNERLEDMIITYVNQIQI